METEYKGNGISSGTTIVAIEYDDGVVIAADSRTSCQNYVSNRLADKLTRITDNIYCCRSGSASQTQALAKEVSSLMNHLEIAMGEPMLVSDAALTFRNHIYRNRSSKITSVIVAGWDKRKGGQVYSVPVSGLCIREPFSVAGSGSTYIQGFVTSQYYPGMPLDETVALAIDAVKLAIGHDCSSGGVVRIGIIDREGIKTGIICKHESDISQVTNKVMWNLEFGQ
ncbi:proteasome subunit beta type-6-like [Drosophila innubila]|uniref:proteasome subunit beta type-6-like n=1 Tax=Drosophila innubila TaxID=198719 RepID=UPI00148D5B32|nr:proteasome subunit beta type-6-like [Drosophila innubila]